MLYMWFAKTLQTHRGDAFRKPQKPRLHVYRQPSNFRGDGFIQDFDPPGHGPNISYF